MTNEGRIDHKYLFVFPVFGIDLNKSGLGRFTNERVRLDFVVQSAIQQLMTIMLEKAALDQEDCQLSNSLTIMIRWTSII